MMKRALLLAAAVTLAATPAAAAAADKRMVSYDAMSPSARALTGAGLTFVFTKSLLRTRVLAVRATAVPVGVVVEPSGDGGTNRKLDALMGQYAGSGALYEIKAGKEQGDVMVQAFCPGSTRGWLAISSIAHARPLKVHAFGDDPASGEPRLCSVMDFDFRGEWRMPRENSADPTDYVFSPNW